MPLLQIFLNIILKTQLSTFILIFNLVILNEAKFCFRTIELDRGKGTLIFDFSSFGKSSAHNVCTALPPSYHVHFYFETSLTRYFSQARMSSGGRALGVLLPSGVCFCVQLHVSLSSVFKIRSCYLKLERY